MITREVDYAIRIMMCLVKNPENTITTHEISETMQVPYRILRKISSKLVSAGIIRSKLGRAGGLTLADRLKELSLLDIINAINPDCRILNACLRKEAFCPRDTTCKVHQRLLDTQYILDRELKAITFTQLVKETPS